MEGSGQRAPKRRARDACEEPWTHEPSSERARTNPPQERESGTSRGTARKNSTDIDMIRKDFRFGTGEGQMKPRAWPPA